MRAATALDAEALDAGAVAAGGAALTGAEYRIKEVEATDNHKTQSCGPLVENIEKIAIVSVTRATEAQRARGDRVAAPLLNHLQTDVVLTLPKEAIQLKGTKRIRRTTRGDKGRTT